MIDSPPEEVWKLLHDPSRLPEWMDGVGSVEDVRAPRAAADYTLYPEGYPDFPMAQRDRTTRDRRRVTVSCHVSFLEFAWTLEEADGDRTRLGVHVELPEAEAAPARRPARRRPRLARAAGYGRASSTRLNGVSVARRKRLKPASSAISRSRASPAWAPEAVAAVLRERVRAADERRGPVEQPADGLRLSSSRSPA